MESKTPQTPAVLIFILAMVCLVSIVVLQALGKTVPDVVHYVLAGALTALGIGLPGRGGGGVNPQVMEALAALVADKVQAHAQASPPTVVAVAPLPVQLPQQQGEMVATREAPSASDNSVSRE